MEDGIRKKGKCEFTGRKEVPIDINKTFQLKKTKIPFKINRRLTEVPNEASLLIVKRLSCQKKKYIRLGLPKFLNIKDL